MKVAIIGTGRMGSAFATAFAKSTAISKYADGDSPVPSTSPSTNSNDSPASMRRCAHASRELHNEGVPSLATILFQKNEPVGCALR